MDLTSLRTLGYETRKAARDSFYRRTRLLYDFDVEPDQIDVLRTLLLMSYCDDNPDDRKDAWYWVGAATSHTHVLELWKKAGSNSDGMGSPLIRRIWWCCFVRDAVVSLSMRRPMRLAAFKDAVPMLTLGDFSWEGHETHVLQEEQDLACTFIEMAKLAKCICPIAPIHNIPGQEMLDRDIQMCDADLIDWFQALPEDSWRRTGENIQEIGSVAIIVSRISLLLAYHGAVFALHIPQAVSVSRGNSNRCSQLRVHFRKARDAAQQTCHLANQILEYGLVDRLSSQVYVLPFTVIPQIPNTSLMTVRTRFMAFLPALSFQILNLKSSSPSMHEETLRGIRSCLQVMVVLSERYPAALSIVKGVEDAMIKTGVVVNISAPGHGSTEISTSPTSFRGSVSPDRFPRNPMQPAPSLRRYQPVRHAIPVLTPPEAIEQGSRKDASNAVADADYFSDVIFNTLETATPLQVWVPTPPDENHEENWATGESDFFGDYLMGEDSFLDLPDHQIETPESLSNLGQLRQGDSSNHVAADLEVPWMTKDKKWDDFWL